ncbi:MAG: DNA alkylation repair protein [Bacteroidetes bacterium]|nr:DNA alkylation repair protein [Bacteroidota bacterium]
MHPYHREILEQIKQKSGKPTHHTFLDHYLGNTHPRYPINSARLRGIARNWMRDHRDMSATELSRILDSLIKGKSSTEKCMVGLLLDYSKKEQRKFRPALFGKWLNELEGWAEIDSVCTGKYALTEVPGQWPAWKSLAEKLARSKNINKRRASLVIFCQPLRKVHEPEILKAALRNTDMLCHEKEVLITKAISWVLRCAAKTFPAEIKKYVNLNKARLPAIAVRETMRVIETGRKTKRKIQNAE